MESEIKIVLTSFIISIIVALFVLPALKRFKVRSNRKRIWAKVTSDKTRNSYYGWNHNCNNTYNCILYNVHKQ